jgi:hypothetical protein
MDEVFFHQIRFTTRTINDWMRPVNMGGLTKSRRDLVTLIMQAIVSLVVLIVGCYLVTKNPDSASQKTGYSLIGLVTGYWLR